ncbi:MAG: tetratricopeptide repeat protein [Planctomycetales bacterium]|nr:tetratricopeptide repeat protein [Planctomycetales bacterium]
MAWLSQIELRSAVLAQVAWLLLMLMNANVVRAADFAQARNAFYQGDYQTCIELTRSEVDKGIWNDIWSRQLIECLLASGHYAEAVELYEQVAEKFSNSIPLRVLAAKAYRFSGDHQRGTRLLDEIPQLVQAAPYRFSDRDNLLAIGRYLLSLGEDPRRVLSEFFDRALKSDPRFVDAHVAIAELALDKADFQEAVKSLSVAIELRPEDPRLHVLLARAWAPSDKKQASAALKSALEINPRHVDALLMQAEELVDAEDFDSAEKLIEQIFMVNASEPRAWCLRAAIANLSGQYEREGECRKLALATWQMNPEVDYLIGKILSQHYRFAEAVRYQRRSLHLDPSYLPAKFQLAQDLLRSGQDDEGWSLVDQVAEADKYNVVAFNLKTLQEQLSQFTTLQRDGLIVRMDTRESRIYGERVLELISQARQVLCAKYEHELSEPVTIEIFPRQSDFAIRTFGLPGGAGFLGVCFGSLITANSPASQGNAPTNWESVLWHEFCHVVTLQKTHNRMPRWLSEGISVYEEVERDSSWGQSLTPANKQMLLGEDFVPLSQLSAAFLQPKSGLHLQFAYFESSLAVRYLIDEHGLPLLQKLLVDLGAGVPLVDAMERRYGQMGKLDEDFQRYAREQANSYLHQTDFTPREELADFPMQGGVTELQQWLAVHPQNYFAQRKLAELQIADKDWSAARTAVERLLELYPEDAEKGGGLMLMALIAREQGDAASEREALQRLVAISSDDLPALQRLIELNRQAEDWEGLAKTARLMLAAQPLLTTGHAALVEAATHLEHPADGIQSLRALQELQPLDPAGLHYQLAQALTEADRLEQARREVLLALEETPRYRLAQKLLVNIHARLNTRRLRFEVEAPDNGHAPHPAINAR